MKPINLLVGGLTLFTAQGCKAPKQVVEQSEHPNIIYVFPDQYRNQAMGFWSQDGFRDKVNFEGDPVVLCVRMRSASVMYLAKLVMIVLISVNFMQIFPLRMIPNIRDNM